MDKQAVVSGASGLGDLKEGRKLGDECSDNRADDLVNDAIRERGADYVKKEGANERSLDFAT
jgi:hypothetical protein